jgi:predicted Zn-dependent protease
MNAFASAAGHITIFTGLLANLDREDELAGIIAHELAHVSERHIAKSIEKNKLVGAGSLLGILAGILVGSQTKSGDSGGALVMGSIAGSQAMQLQYSRENERDADQYGLDYLVRAGFSPQGMVTGFEKIRRLQRLAGGGNTPSYLSTHPGMSERAAYMRDRIARLPLTVRERPVHNDAFLRAKALVLARYTDPNTAIAVFSTSPSPYPPCLALLGEAVARSRLRQSEAARAGFEKAMACGGDDALWKREYGRFAFEYGDLQDAARALQEAVVRAPDDLFALFFYALAMGEQGKYATSIEALQRVLKAVPRDAEVLETLGRQQAAQGMQFEAHMNYAKAFAYRRQFKKYTFHMERAEAAARTEAQRAAIQAARDEISEYREILES